MIETLDEVLSRSQTEQRPPQDVAIDIAKARIAEEQAGLGRKFCSYRRGGRLGGWLRMMKATGTDPGAGSKPDGKPVAVLNHAKLGFSLEGVAYTVRRSGFLGPLYELQQDGVTLLSAKAGSSTLSFTKSLGDRHSTLKGIGMSERRFGPVRGRYPGRPHLARRQGPLHNRDHHRPALERRCQQVFLLWLLWKWGAPTFRRSRRPHRRSATGRG